MSLQTSVPTQAGVGRLGIITRVKFPMVPQAAVKRELSMLSIDEFAKELTQVQEDYIAAKAAGTTDAINKAFLPISEVLVWRLTFSRLSYSVASIQRDAQGSYH